ncbi:MAG: nucleotidyltransferase domain-containing protein [Balneolaceae bacterium]|nr:nucleotidyltransferase domain-containing protein [Balneolaceae bacterium]MCH8549238.1 nucleotidyltransferase domain-containing protein [Balneolaceae bacterium]
MKISELKTEELKQACVNYQVKELYVFGSAVTGQITQNSDLDFLVEFKRSGFEGAFDQYMGLKESLEKIYGRSVDLIHQKKFRNPLFEEEVHKTKALLYTA